MLRSAVPAAPPARTCILRLAGMGNILSLRSGRRLQQPESFGENAEHAYDRVRGHSIFCQVDAAILR